MQISLWLLWKGQSTILSLFGRRILGQYPAAPSSPGPFVLLLNHDVSNIYIYIYLSQSSLRMARSILVVIVCYSLCSSQWKHVSANICISSQVPQGPEGHGDEILRKVRKTNTEFVAICSHHTPFLFHDMCFVATMNLSAKGGPYSVEPTIHMRIVPGSHRGL